MTSRDIGSNITNSVSAEPLSSFFSTNLNHKINCMDKLAERIAMTLGYPQVNVEVHANQVLDNISIGCEMFTKFAGYTEEYLVFNSGLYEKGMGIQIDKLMSMTPHLSGTVTVPTSGVVDDDPPAEGVEVNLKFDYDLDSYRKVIDVFAFEEGSTTGVNTLFTIEQTMAQQTYFSYAMGKYGFDLVSWYTLKNWLDTRKKLLAQEHYYKFDERTQRLYLTPDPQKGDKSQFYGVVGAYVEKPIRDLIKEPWIYQYALALTKINLGRIRGKYAGTALFGGGVPNYQDILTEGNTEKQQLEERLYQNDPGLGDAAPPQFFVG